MLHEIKVPEAGFGIAEATIVEWFKSIGDAVEEGEPVVAVETEKVNVEIPAPGSGILTEIRCQVGAVVPVGEVLGMIAAEADAAVADQVRANAPEPEADRAVPAHSIPGGGEKARKKRS